jgi:uncharacterized protein YecT (DUF1311 family)
MSSNGESMIICKKCGTENKNGDSFCKGCGSNLLEQKHDEALPLPQDDSIAVCQECGTKPQSGDSFCRGCGGSLVENKNAENISKEKANKKVWLSIVAVAVGVLLIAIVLKISNNSDYTTEAAPAATEDVAPAAEEISYREAMPFTTNNYYELNNRTNKVLGVLQLSSASEVVRMKVAFRDPIEDMGYDFDKTLLSKSKADSLDLDSAIGFGFMIGTVKDTVGRYPDESVLKGLVSEETKNIIVEAREAALQKSKERADAAALKSAWESVPADEKKDEDQEQNFKKFNDKYSKISDSEYLSLKKQHPEYSLVDGELSRAFSALRKTLSKEEKQKLKIDQLKWIDTRDQKASNAGSKGTDAYVNALIQITKERVEYLQSVIE